MNDQINAEVFSEIVERAKSGKSDRLPSVDRAIVWASQEIDRLRIIEPKLKKAMDGIAAMTKITPPPFSNLHAHQTLALSPSKLIAHCNQLAAECSVEKGGE